MLTTSLPTWIGCHANRGKKAFDAVGPLTEFVGTLIHDGWKPYRDLACTHALCNAHHLRELTYAFEEMRQAWDYDTIHAEGEAANPRAPPSGRRAVPSRARRST